MSQNVKRKKDGKDSVRDEESENESGKLNSKIGLPVLEEPPSPASSSKNPMKTTLKNRKQSQDQVLREKK